MSPLLLDVSHFSRSHSFFFRFSGPSISLDTACSSSFAALHVACQSLRQGGCDTAIAGGTNILTNPDNFAGLDRGHFLSTTGNCNPFDDEASGYCRADAVASLVLKRLEDAEADNDPIYGVIVSLFRAHFTFSRMYLKPLLLERNLGIIRYPIAAMLNPNFPTGWRGHQSLRSDGIYHSAARRGPAFLVQANSSTV